MNDMRVDHAKLEGDLQTLSVLEDLCNETSRSASDISSTKQQVEKLLESKKQRSKTVQDYYDQVRDRCLDQAQPLVAEGSPADLAIAQAAQTVVQALQNSRGQRVNPRGRATQPAPAPVASTVVSSPAMRPAFRTAVEELVPAVLNQIIHSFGSRSTESNAGPYSQYIKRGDIVDDMTILATVSRKSLPRIFVFLQAKTVTFLRT